jgi:hypothetical protein
LNHASILQILVCEFHHVESFVVVLDIWRISVNVLDTPVACLTRSFEAVRCSEKMHNVILCVIKLAKVSDYRGRSSIVWALKQYNY